MTRDPSWPLSKIWMLPVASQVGLCWPTVFEYLKDSAPDFPSIDRNTTVVARGEHDVAGRRSRRAH